MDRHLQGPRHREPAARVFVKQVEPADQDVVQAHGELPFHRVDDLGPDVGPRIMLAGHMDEVGAIVRYITPEGMVKFQLLGGWLDCAQIDAVLHRKGRYAVPRKGWRFWERCRWPI